MSRWPDTRFGFTVPHVFTDAPPDMGVVADTVRLVDEAGADSLWMQSQLVGHADVLEQMTLLSYAAACTSRVKLGTSVAVVTEHHPLQLAKQLASLDVISGGRLIAGLGTGALAHRAEVEGIDDSRQVRRLIETIGILRALWASDDASFEGELWRFEHTSMNPKPLQRPGPPIWLGGFHPNALRRAARYGDGWMGQGARSNEEFLGIISFLHETLEELGRDRDAFTISKRIYVAVEKRKGDAEERIRRRFQLYNGAPERGPRVTLHGDAEEIAAGIQEVVDVGTQLVVFTPLYDFVAQTDALLEIIGA